MEYIFVTRSSDKAREVERMLGVPIERRDLDLPELQAVDVKDVVAAKARLAYETLGGMPVIVEDTGLYIDAWNKLPGALVRWFIQCVGDEGICAMLSAFSNRAAWAETAVGTYDGQLRIYAGRVDGRIAPQPAGRGGFGWDTIFVPNGSEKTFAEMTPTEKDRYSMRRIAFEAMLAAMKESRLEQDEGGS